MSGEHDSDPELAELAAAKRWMELVKALGRRAEVAAPSARAELHFRIGVIYQDQFANHAEAIRAFSRVLEDEPDHPKAIAALRALYERRRDWEHLLELEKAELRRTEPEHRADKALDVARLAAARVSKPDLQLYWWERVLEHTPDHRQATVELSKLYAHAERWQDLAELLRRQAELAPGNDDLAAALRRLAFVSDHCLGDRQAAREALEQLVDLVPGDADARSALAQLRAGREVAWPSLGDGFRVAGVMARAASAGLPVAANADDAAPVEQSPGEPVAGSGPQRRAVPAAPIVLAIAVAAIAIGLYLVLG